MLAEVHLALVVATPSSAYVMGLRKRAAALSRLTECTWWAMCQSTRSCRFCPAPTSG